VSIFPHHSYSVLLSNATEENHPKKGKKENLPSHCQTPFFLLCCGNENATDNDCAEICLSTCQRDQQMVETVSKNTHSKLIIRNH